MTKKKSDKTKITRISASDTTPKQSAPKKATKTVRSSKKDDVKEVKKPTKKAPVEAEVVETKDTTEKAVATDKKPSKKSKKKTEKSNKKRMQNPFDAYLSGAWSELKQVRWPDRSETWTMTVGLVSFTIFSAVLVLILDAIFKYLFKLTIGV